MFNNNIFLSDTPFKKSDFQKGSTWKADHGNLYQIFQSYFFFQFNSILYEPVI